MLVIDHCLSIWLWRVGFTLGPWFLTLDWDMDIAYFFGSKEQPPLSEYHAEFSYDPDKGWVCEENFSLGFDSAI